jgi:AcrR family transcriptional regulator
MPSGRRRRIDTNEALGRALDVVWARGYEGATLPELTKALGISRPSPYGAFGNKQQLFLMKRYLYDNNGHHRTRLLDAIAGMKRHSVAPLTGAGASKFRHLFGQRNHP